MTVAKLIDPHVMRVIDGPELPMFNQRLDALVVEVLSEFHPIVSLAADRGFDSKRLRDQLRNDRIRPPIPHREVSSLKETHNARIDRKSYNRRWMVETTISSIKRTFGAAGRARSWWLELHELLLKTAVYNIQTALRRGNSVP